MDPENDDFALLGGLEGGTQQPDVAGGFGDDMVGGKNAHRRIGVHLIEQMGHQSDGGRGVTLHGFREDLPLGHLRQLFHDLRAEQLIGKDPDVFGRQDRGQAIDRLLDQGALAEEVQHLLGAGTPAAWPEAGTPASGQDQAVAVRWH